MPSEEHSQGLTPAMMAFIVIVLLAVFTEFCAYEQLINAR